MGDVVSVPWYATVGRGDTLEAALAEIAPVALRYGASEYELYRSDDDRYRMLQLATFAEHGDFERYWYGPEFNHWRERNQGRFQVPVVYVWQTRVARGTMAATAELAAR